MPNVKSIINKRNKTVLDPPTNTSERTCNCINIDIIYKAILISNQDTYQHKIYYGIT